MDIDVLWVWLQDEVETALDAALPATSPLDDEARYALSADITNRIHASISTRICMNTQAQRDLCLLEALWSASNVDATDVTSVTCAKPCGGTLPPAAPQGA